jgi:hypothetical protein
MSRRRRFAARNVDDELARDALYLAGEASPWRRCACALEHVELVVACRFQTLEPRAHHDTAARAGERATAFVRNVDAILQQAIKECFAVA